MKIKAPDNWQSLCDCFNCDYFLACYQPVRRMCKTAESFLYEQMRKEWREKYHDIVIENDDWGENQE